MSHRQIISFRPTGVKMRGSFHRARNIFARFPIHAVGTGGPENSLQRFGRGINSILDANAQLRTTCRSAPSMTSPADFLSSLSARLCTYDHGTSSRRSEFVARFKTIGNVPGCRPDSNRARSARVGSWNVGGAIALLRNSETENVPQNRHGIARSFRSMCGLASKRWPQWEHEFPR